MSADGCTHSTNHARGFEYSAQGYSSHAWCAAADSDTHTGLRLQATQLCPYCKQLKQLCVLYFFTMKAHLQPLLQAKQLTHCHGSYRVLENISLDVDRGEILALLGLNGAGKSTTLNILAGVLAPTSGQVIIDGVDQTEAPLLARKRIGYLPDVPPMYNDMRVGEYLLYAARLRRLPLKRARSRVAETLEQCELGDVSKRIIGNLSKGYRQRIGLAQAIVHQPDVILLDEPSSGMDPQQMQSMRDMLKRLAADHAIVFSTHLLSEATAISTAACVVHNGQVIKHEWLGSNDGSTCQLRVRIREVLHPSELLRIDGVLAAVAREPHEWELRVQPSAYDSILPQLLASGWHVVEFGPLQPALESLFNELSREPANEEVAV